MVTNNKQENIQNALDCIGKASRNDAKLVVLPVCIGNMSAQSSKKNSSIRKKKET